MDLQSAHQSVRAILDKLDFSALFDGFHRFRFALYNAEQICLDGVLMPYQEDFRGNTCIFYRDEFIAIWDLGFDPIEDMEILAYSLVHEMFHCYQRENNESRYPSDLTLLNYPDDPENFLKKYNENGYLADAYENGDMEAFRKFHAIRNQRLAAYPEMVAQELRTETLEGLAEYVGLKALERICPDKLAAITTSYVEKLRAQEPLLFDIRRISYYTGALYFLSLDRLGFAIKNAFDNECTAYEQNAESVAEVPTQIIPCDFISRSYAELRAHRQQIIDANIAGAAFNPCEGFICGYDPMNMFRLGDIIFCSHFICLNIGGKVEMISSAVALKLKEGSNHEITGYYR